MAKKKDDIYFQSMVRMAEYALDAARELDRLFCSFRPDELQAAIQPLHTTEHSADTLMHETLDKLIHEFITPIEREDINAVLSALDNVVDSIEDVAIKAHMFNLLSIRSEGIVMCDIIKKSTSAMAELMKEFSDFKKSKKIGEMIKVINDLESEADSVYAAGVRKLYTEENDAIAVVAWTRMFDSLEKCCDAVEHVAHQVGTAILKNT